MTETNTIPVTVPLLNPNEPEAVLVDLFVEEGQYVKKGETLFTLETTKSAADVEAETEGYVAGLRRRKGDRLRAGEILCYLAESPDWQPEEAELGGQRAEKVSEEPPDGLRITAKALEYARRVGIPLGGLDIGPIWTEEMLRGRARVEVAPERVPYPMDLEHILLYGGGGHAKMLIDLLRGIPGYQIVGILDDGILPDLDTGELPKVLGVPVLGGKEKLLELHDRGIRLAANAVGGVGNIAIRQAISARLASAGFTCPSVVHRTAFVEPSARLEPGAQVFAGAYVGSDASIGQDAIVNNGSIISHDCRLEPFSIVSPGAILAGEVHVGSGALIGMGATVNLRVRIGDGARVGNGATVKEDVPAGEIVRAGAIWPG